MCKMRKSATLVDSYSHIHSYCVGFCSCPQYALYKKMTQAAILIQSKFRSYHEQKKFQQSKRAAVLIQQYYRSYKEFGRLKPHHRGAAAALVQHKLRYTLRPTLH